MKEFREMAGYKIETVKCVALLSAGDGQGNAVITRTIESEEMQKTQNSGGRANEGHPRVLRQKFKCESIYEQQTL